MNSCQVPDCGKPVYARGWCSPHYQRWLHRGGDPAVRMPMGPAKGKFVKERTCSVEGCNARHYGHGFCKLHWLRWRTNGDPLIFHPPNRVPPPPRPVRSPQDRARDKFTVGTPDECWPWMGKSKTRDGYGLIPKGPGQKGNFYAHRVVFEMYGGVIPDGYELDHLCFNPSCVNPAHLEPVTKAENMRRARLEHDSVTGVFQRPR